MGVLLVDGRDPELVGALQFRVGSLLRSVGGLYKQEWLPPPSLAALKISREKLSASRR
jgi:hypothetical protein